MSEAVERRLLELLDQPTESPYGNPIPGLAELGAEAAEDFMDGRRVADAAVSDGAEVRLRIRRISEEVQKDEVLMAALRRVGALPDRDVKATQGPEGVLVGSGGETAEIDPELADHVFVRSALTPYVP